MGSSPIIPSPTYPTLSQYAAFSTQNITPAPSTMLYVWNGYFGAPSPFTGLNVAALGNPSGQSPSGIVAATTELTNLQYYLTGRIVGAQSSISPTGRSKTYLPGIYYFPNGIAINDTQILFDAAGDASGQFIFLTDSPNGITCSNNTLQLLNGALPQNVILYSSGGDITLTSNAPSQYYIAGTFVSERNINIDNVSINGCVYANQYIRTTTASATIRFPSQTFIIDPAVNSILATYELVGLNISSVGTTTVINGNVGVPLSSAIPSTLVLGPNSVVDKTNYSTASAEIGTFFTSLTNRPQTGANYTGASTTLGPGNYFSTSTIDFAPSTPLFLDGQNDSSSQFVFIAETGMTFGSGVSIFLVNGAVPQNVIFAAINSITVNNTTYTPFQGSLICGGTINFVDNVNIYGTISSGNGYIEFNGSGNSQVRRMITSPNVPCFFKGTQILTDKGCVAVESLKPGDNIQTFAQITDNFEVILHDAKIQKCISIKNLVVFNPRPSTGLICFSGGSLGENLPAHNLYVSPDHGVFADGYLRVAKSFVNGNTIFYEQSCKKIDYYHIMLDTYACVQANGVLCESFREK